jgi:hypothetical protein
MPMVKSKERSRKERYLLMGAPNSGKTYSLGTFIYGQHCYTPGREAEALAYAGDRNMLIIGCPGEKGLASLPVGDHITSVRPEYTAADRSSTIVRDFEAALNECTTGDGIPDILALDGIHSLFDYYMDVLCDGQYLTGGEYSSLLFGRARYQFGQLLSRLYNSKVPIIVCTVWEEWENRDDNIPMIQPKGVPPPVKVLYPALPGKAAKAVIGHFDATLRAGIEKQCMHDTCDDHKAKREHYTWQFLPKGDVKGVGIKGMAHPTPEMVQKPYMHPSYPVLKFVMEKYR